jgi:hypothetical protein
LWTLHAAPVTPRYGRLLRSDGARLAVVIVGEEGGQRLGVTRIGRPRSSGDPRPQRLGQPAGAAWAPGQAVKLFKPGGERRLCRHEAQMTRAAFAAGLPAPEVFDEVTLEGRFGIVLSRFE